MLLQLTKLNPTPHLCVSMSDTIGHNIVATFKHPVRPLNLYPNLIRTIIL